MKLHKWLLGATILASALTARGDEPFRMHRYDSFNACKVNENSIVFIGNSITNMGAWPEHFGDDSRFINRGNSGCYSYESLDELESILVGKPAKIFVMVGTNDIGGLTGTPESIALNARVMIERVKRESPATRLYITSCFPSQNGYRNLTNLGETNRLLQEVCDQTGTAYVDLWNELMGITTGALSTDNLHINAKGYYIWSKKIAELLADDGVTVALPANPTLVTGGLNYSWGMRVGLFGALPVKADDVLMIGDEMINGGEWHELLNCPRVKNRGSGWGYGGVINGLPSWANMIEPIFKSNANKQTPAQTYLYAGVAQVNGSEPISSIVSQYQTVVNNIKKHAPDTRLHLMSLLPVSNAAANSRVKQFNQHLREMAATGGDTYVDIFSPLALPDGSPDPAYITDNYVYAAGYNRIARVLAPLIGDDCSVMSEEEFTSHHATIEARRRLGLVINKALTLPVGTTTGTYDIESMGALNNKLDEIYNALGSDNISTEGLAALAKECEPLLSQAQVLNQPNSTSWYTICSSRRDNRYVTVDNETGLLTGNSESSSSAAQWRFEKRDDGTWNIINRFTGHYITPVAPQNSQLSTSVSEPSAGWTLSNGSTTRLYIITSGTTQLNQTTSALGYKVYNWGYGSVTDAPGSFNTTDAGCEFTITELDKDAPVIDPDKIIFEPTPSTETETVWHVFFTPMRENKYVSADTSATGPMTGTSNAEGQAVQWKIVPREGESTFDIINRQTGGYINPASAANGQQLHTSASSPAKGWQFSAAATAGHYIVTSEGSVQLHQANGGNAYKIFNWGSGTNTTDAGCQYRIKVVDIVKNPEVGLSMTATDGNDEDAVFDLLGRRVNATPSKGIYIINGTKTLVR